MIPTTRKVTLDESSELKQDNLTTDQMKEFANDLKKLSTSSKTKSVVTTINLERKKEKFTSRVKNVLDKFDTIKLDNQDEKLQLLFLFVMQSANDILGQSDETTDICTSLLKPFVNGDENLTKNIMNIVKSKVKPLTMYRKYKHHLYHIASFFFVTFAKIK